MKKSLPIILAIIVLFFAISMVVSLLYRPQIDAFMNRKAKEIFNLDITNSAQKENNTIHSNTMHFNGQEE